MQQKLAGKKRRYGEREETEADLAAAMEKKMFPTFDDNVDKTKTKEDQRNSALKRKYQLDIKKQANKKFSGSSFLTPESVAYLNSALK